MYYDQFGHIDHFILGFIIVIKYFILVARHRIINHFLFIANLTFIFNFTFLMKALYHFLDHRLYYFIIYLYQVLLIKFHVFMVFRCQHLINHHSFIYLKVFNLSFRLFLNALIIIYSSRNSI